MYTSIKTSDKPKIRLRVCVEDYSPACIKFKSTELCFE